MPPVAPLPERIHVGEQMRAAVVAERDVLQPGALQQAAELARIAEAQGRMRLRHLRRRRGADLGNGLADQALDALPVHSVPPREGDAAAGFERAQALGDGGLGIGKMADAEGADDRIEGAVGQRQALDLARRGSRCRDACAAQPPACRSRGPRRRPARPRLAASAASAPQPVATSSSLLPGPTRTASSSGAMASAVTGAKNPA